MYVYPRSRKSYLASEVIRQKTSISKLPAECIVDVKDSYILVVASDVAWEICESGLRASGSTIPIKALEAASIETTFFSHCDLMNVKGVLVEGDFFYTRICLSLSESGSNATAAGGSLGCQIGEVPLISTRSH